MTRHFMKQKYFVPKELRLSIAIIVLWALLISSFFTYIAKEYGGKIGHDTLLFAIIMAGYIVIVFVLSMLFSHRLLGPFQRLKTDIRLIVSGDYQRRLKIRQNDDIYIRSFLIEVNNLLDDFEKMHNYKENVVKYIDMEILDMISAIEEGGPSKEKLREEILYFHKRIKNMSEEPSVADVSSQ
jgi:hypothetical protein